MDQRAGSLQADGLPCSSHTRTFHQQRRREGKGLPPYGNLRRLIRIDPAAVPEIAFSDAQSCFTRGDQDLIGRLLFAPRAEVRFQHPLEARLRSVNSQRVHQGIHSVVLPDA